MIPLRDKPQYARGREYRTLWSYLLQFPRRLRFHDHHVRVVRVTGELMHRTESLPSRSVYPFDHAVVHQLPPTPECRRRDPSALQIAALMLEHHAEGIGGVGGADADHSQAVEHPANLCVASTV